MKQLFLFLLLSVFLFNMAGIPWLFVRQQKLHQQKTWKSIESHSKKGDFIDISKDGCIVINDHEIIYRGKLYDIRNKQINENKMDYACTEDKEEERLINVLDDLVKSNSSSSYASVFSKTLKIFKTIIQDSFVASF